MMTCRDDSLLSGFEREEVEDPSPSKRVDDVRTIYGSEAPETWARGRMLRFLAIRYFVILAKLGSEARIPVLSSLTSIVLRSFDLT